MSTYTEKITVSCDGCDAAIALYPSQFNRNKSGVFRCSKSCGAKRESRNCVHCGAGFTDYSYSKRKTCGKACPALFTKHSCVSCHETFLLPKEKLAQKFCGTKCRVDWFAKNPECHWDGETPPNYYSPKRRAIIKRGEKINHFRLYETYNWKCHLCLDTIDKNLRFPNAMAATVDHILPLSKGGSHTWDNVAPAHASCNFKKGNVV